MISIRRATPDDDSAIWAILKPVFRAGDTYAIDADISRDAALGYWCGGNHTAFVAEIEGRTRGSYYICANQRGGGAHVCNCGFATLPAARGQGLAGAMLDHAQATARAMGFLAMQFNFVVASNEGALRLWHGAGFETVGRLPRAFCHPRAGYVDALVLYKTL